MNTLNSSPLSDCGGLAILPAPLLLHQGEDLPALPLAIAAEGPRPTVPRIPGHLQTWWTGHPTSDILWGPVGFQSPPLLCASRPWDWPFYHHHCLDTVAQLLIQKARASPERFCPSLCLIEERRNGN